MKWFLRLALVLVVMGISPGLTYGKAAVVIPGQVSVAGRQILLLEIAQVTGAASSLTLELEGIFLGPSPAPGASLVLPRATIMTRLRSRVTSMERFDWRVAEKVTISRASATVGRAQVIEALKRFITDRMILPIENLTFSDMQVRTPLQVPKGEISLSFQEREGDDLFGATSLTLLIAVDGETVGEIPVRVRIDGDVEVLVTTRSLRRGDVVGAGDVVLRKRMLSRAGNSPALDVSEVAGKVLRRALGRNRVVSLSDLTEKPLVERGQQVTLVLRTESMAIGCPGEAREDGRKGDYITVKNEMSGKLVKGRVLADGTVEVAFRRPPRVTVSSGYPR